jgi:hypothetical protein
MGYYNYQNGLIYHNLNQEGRWLNHQNRCREIILRACDLYKPSVVTVLGSGWLLDLPLTELAGRSKKLYLVDIIHPPDVKNQVKSLKNVVLEEEDVTGGLIAEVWQKARKYSFFRKLKSLDQINIPVFNFKHDPGMIISLNILTQLESLPVDFLKKRSKIPESEFTRFRAEIQQHHLELLKKNKSVLITDYAEELTGKSGDIKTNTTLLAELPGGRNKEEWIWNFDKAGGDLYNSTSQFRIVGIIF